MGKEEQHRIRIAKLLRRDLGQRLFSGLGPGGERVLLHQIIPAQKVPDPEEIERLEAMGEVMLGIKSVHVPEVRSWEVDDRGVLEFSSVDPSGVFLAALLSNGVMALPHALAVFEQLLSALLPLHEKGLPYGLAHPDCLILDRRGKVILPEAGLVGAALPQLSSSFGRSGARFQQLFAEADLVPPELLRGGTLTPASDVFQAASLFYRLVTGRSAFGEGMSLEIYNRMLNDQGLVSSEGIPAAGSGLTQLVTECLAAAPGSRPPNASETKGRLLSLRGQKRGLGELILKHAESPYSGRFKEILSIHSGGVPPVETLEDGHEGEYTEAQRELLLGQLDRMRAGRRAPGGQGRSLGPWLIGLIIVAAAAIGSYYLLDLGGDGARKYEGRLPQDGDGRSHHQIVYSDNGASHPSARSLFEAVPPAVKERLQRMDVNLAGDMSFEPPVLPPYKVRLEQGDGNLVVFEFTARNRLHSVVLPPPITPERAERLMVLYDAGGTPRLLLTMDATGKPMNYDSL